MAARKRRPARRLDKFNFPPDDGPVLRATKTKQKLGIPAGVTHGWAVFVLPFMEQQALYDLYRRDLDWKHATNAPVRTAHVATCRRDH